MNNQILLIEDRISRQENYLSKYKVDLSNFSILKNIKGGQEFLDIKKELSDANAAAFESYNCILTHRSGLDQSEREFLYNLCKRDKKSLAFFSGGISSVSFSDNDQFQFLSINSSDFYSTRMLFFLEEAQNNNMNLLHLAFGKEWQLNLLLNFLTIVKKVSYDKDFEAERIPVLILKSTIGLDNSVMPEILSKYKISPPWLDESMVAKPREKLIELHRNLIEILRTLTLQNESITD